MNDTLPALTIRQPWAWAIVRGFKRIENRVWRTKYRGPLIIHAGVKFDDAAADWLRARGIDVPSRDQIALGAIVGIVDLVDVVPYDQPGLFESLRNDPCASGPFCWILERPRELAVPVSCSGSQRLFRVPRSMVEGIVVSINQTAQAKGKPAR